MIRPDTELLTDTGRTPVTDYQSGDEALASDPTTGRAAPKPIAAVESVVPESEAVHIRVRRGDGRVCSTHRQGLHTAEGDRQRPLRAGDVDADRICRFVIDTTDRLPPDAQVTRTTPEWAPCYRLAVVDPPPCPDWLRRAFQSVETSVVASRADYRNRPTRDPSAISGRPTESA